MINGNIGSAPGAGSRTSDNDPGRYTSARTTISHRRPPPGQLQAAVSQIPQHPLLSDSQVLILTP
jgi:hypothetical protein